MHWLQDSFQNWMLIISQSEGWLKQNRQLQKLIFREMKMMKVRVLAVQEKDSPPLLSSKSSSDTPVLDNFGIDLTKAAEEGRLDPIVGREREIERLAQILSRRKKNNPILIGEPGLVNQQLLKDLP